MEAYASGSANVLLWIRDYQFFSCFVDKLHLYILIYINMYNVGGIYSFISSGFDIIHENHQFIVI